MVVATGRLVSEPTSPISAGPGRLVGGAGAAVVSAASTRLFQAPQAGHRPAHFGWVPPHSSQTWWTRDLDVVVLAGVLDMRSA